jgi:hypothetical protein
MDEIDERLERWMSATASVAPREGFTARVMAAVEKEGAPGVFMLLPRAARRAMPIAAIAAAAAVVWAVTAVRDADDAAIGSYGSSEVE